MTERLTARERMTWDNLLDLEPIEISRQAKTLFQKAQSKLSVGSGHHITGISGNDRALACLSLLLVKLVYIFLKIGLTDFLLTNLL